MKPRIAILGTRGIIIKDASISGGFETFAKKLSVRLVQRKCADVTVYIPHYIDYDREQYEGVNLIKIFNPEHSIGKIGSIVYDYLSYRDALSRDFDIILECGYGSFVPAVFLKKRGVKPYLAVNMDGFEWKRPWFWPLKLFFRITEKLVAKRADFLIADHPVIKDYLQGKYKSVKIEYLSYGTELPQKFDIGYLNKYGLTKDDYFIVVARPIPDNNIELIFKAFEKFTNETKADIKLVWVTNTHSKYARKIMHRFNSSNFLYINTIDEEELFALRHFAIAYIHGHSSGGTNPSLLEAIASKVPIIAHDNEFTRLILQDNSFYFTNVNGLVNLIFTFVNSKAGAKKEINNFDYDKISWESVVDKYCEFLVKNSL